MDIDRDVPATTTAPTAVEPRQTTLTAQAILFDLDGTLIDSTPIVVRCWTRWAQEYSVSGEDFERVHTHGRTAEGIIADLLPPDRVAAAVRRIVELESVELDGLRMLPGASATVAAIPQSQRAVVTSGTLEVASARLAHVGLEPGLLVTADDVRRGKPDPEPYRVAADRLAVPAPECLVVEDAPVGLQAARAAGMQTVAVTTTHDIAELDADLVVEHLGQLHVDLAAGVVSLSGCERRSQRTG